VRVFKFLEATHGRPAGGLQGNSAPLRMRHNACCQKKRHDILPKRLVLRIPTYMSAIIELKRGVR
jgi:hypothetical protein